MIESNLSNRENVQLALGCWYITGATASGKTLVSLALAKQLDAEIISLDSMAIYRGMDVGTAKPSLDQRQEIPHHLIDILDPVETFSVSQYRDRSLDTIRSIRDRGKQVVFVGGTALYLKALLRGIFDGPPADWEFRGEIEKELQHVGLSELYRRLQLVDPLAADKLHPNDKRRIIRALEVYRLTGQPISHLQTEFDDGHSPESCKVFTLRHTPPVLHERIQQRVEWMFEHGLVDEVKTMLARWGQLGQTAAQAVGYREVIEHLTGKRDLNETKELVLFRTRRFARHQETWFRGLRECRILDLPDSISARQQAERLASEIASLGQARR